MPSTLIRVAGFVAIFSVTTMTTASADTQQNGLAITLVHAIQGTSDNNLLNNQMVNIEAIVVGDFQNGDTDQSRNLAGFYVQEEDADADANAMTSEGIFIAEGGNFITDVEVGDRVQLSGTVREAAGETQIDTVTSVLVVSSGNPLPSPAVITLMPDGPTTISAAGRIQADLEAFEGMLVTFADTLTIAEMFQLVRFNEIRLSQGGRLQQFTQGNAPDLNGFADHLQNVGSRTITYDDGLNVQNALIGNLDGFGPTFNTASDVRMGDTIDDLSGVLSYQWAGNSASSATWRVRSTQDGENTFDKTNIRSNTPDAVNGSLKVAGFNVLNYFTTLRNEGTTVLGANPRGASNATEFSRQTEKLVTTILSIDADILGLVELENDFLAGSSGNAIENLVSALNAIVGAGTYAWVDPNSQFVGNDAVSNGLVYKPAKVSIVALDTLVFEESSAATTFATANVLNPYVGVNDRVFDFRRNRPALAATFQDTAGEQLTVAVNHFKSKSDTNLEDLAEEAQIALDAGATQFSQTDIDNLLADPNYDQADGQGFWNAVRTDAAIELVQWLSDTTSSGYAQGMVSDRDFLIIGDLNAYAQEDPVVALESQGYGDLAAAYNPGTRSYVFNGQDGTLDYAMGSAALQTQVTGATIWNINADEPNALDYNTDFGRDVTIFDGSVPFRASDHDPVIVGLSLVTAPGEVFSDGFEGN